MSGRLFSSVQVTDGRVENGERVAAVPGGWCHA